MGWMPRRDARDGSSAARGGGSLPQQPSPPATLPPRDHPPGPAAQLLDHRPHRSRQVHAGRSAAGADAHDRRPPDDEPGPRLDGPRAREGHHDQGPRRAPRVHGQGRPDATGSTSSTRPATSTSPTRSATACRPARARSSSSTPPRASRRRRSPTSTWRCARTSRSSRSSTRSTCPRPTPTRHGRARERAGHPARGGDPRRRQGRHRRRATSSRPSSSASRRPRATPTRRVQGLIFDSHYDAYKGVIVYVRLAQGTLTTTATRSA